ncbi:MAG: large subunit ribosomal protein L19 [Parcubacteria group bacterium Gr01-1014_66]|nr:MAG: large subunit ribosomal protein L19 [Parcubacteria group bacterium Gr01-1014_66]
MDPIELITSPYLRQNLPKIKQGDTVRVLQRIQEGDKERTSPFEGIVIARKHGRGIQATITVRRIVEGIGVERIFPIHSPNIIEIRVLRHGRVRRAKLYYIREKAARDVRKKMRSFAASVLKEEDRVVQGNAAREEASIS